MSGTDTLTRLLAAAGLPSTIPLERLSGLPEMARRLHRTLLHQFADAGAAPDLSAALARLQLDEEHGQRLLAMLAAADLVALGGDGNLAGVFPFSAVPTRHQVALDGGPTVSAMCAIDALGIQAMLGRPGTVTSRDPTTGTPISIRIDAAALEWTPRAAVVLVGRAGDGPVADAYCRIIDFYADPAAAEQALTRPELRGVVLDMPAALDLAVALFGDQLAVPESSPRWRS